MSFRLLKNRKLLMRHVSEVQKLFSGVQNLPLPTGVAGKRIVRKFRSEMGRDVKRAMEEHLKQRKKHEEYKQKHWRDMTLKRMAQAYDSRIFQWKLWVKKSNPDKQLTEQDRAQFKKELERMEARRDQDLRETERELKHQSERYMKERMEAHRGDILARWGTFVYRFKYVMDTYDGQIFRGTAICSKKTQAGWKVVNQFVAPT